MTSTSELADIFIIGGGINGTGIAADAAGRGLNVILCEQDDLANGTSSASSKLIHGGLRYLEQYEFKLVHKALKEREILWHKAPHIIKPLSFVLPYSPGLRPRWLLRMGLWLYDHLAKLQSLPASCTIQLRQHPYGMPLKPNFTVGFVYSDCWVDDARLVVLNAITAAEHSACIYTRQRVVHATRHTDYWTIKTLHTSTQQEQIFKARILINASGPWVNICHQQCIDKNTSLEVELVKGSHIIVKQLYADDQAYILMHPDKRVIFIIPYLDRYTLIGTTDIRYHGDPKLATIQQSEIDYLCDAVNRYLQQSISSKDVIGHYSGVRPLKHQHDSNPSEISRDYELRWDKKARHAPLLSIIGGKITTYRELATEVVDQLAAYFPQQQPSWTASVPLPGGNFANQDINAFIKQCQQQYPWLDAQLCARYAHAYGTRVHILLANTFSIAELGYDFGHTLYAKEVMYLMQHEWAQTAEDILWRRTKLGLEFDKIQVAYLEEWILNSNRN